MRVKGQKNYLVSIGQGLNNMSKYYFLNDWEYKHLLKILSTKKSVEDIEIKKSLEFQNKQLKKDNGSYVLAATNLLMKNYSKQYESEDLLIDNDANVSLMDDGAYVQCWLWVNNDKKTKRANK